MLKRIACLLLVYPVLSLAEPLDRVVAVVNEGVITASELNAEVQLLREQILARHMPLPSDTALQKQVLQHLIDVDLELQMAKEHNITIESSEVDATIAKIAAENKLSLSGLREALANQGMSWEAYKKNLQKEMLIGRLQQKAVGRDVVVTADQVEEYLKNAKHQDKTHLTFHVQNIVIPLPEEPSPEQLQQAKLKVQALLDKIKKGADFNGVAIEESSGEFALEGGDLGERHLAELPELFANTVVNMKVGEVSSPLRTGNGFQLLKLVAVHDDEGKHQVVKTQVRHILIKPDSSMTTEKAISQVNKIRQQLSTGKDFALLAKQYSLDATSATKGGDLGWVNPGELAPEFEKAMNALPLHQVSKPIKTQFGWHLIEVLGRKQVDDSASYKRQQVRSFLQQRKFTEAVQNWQQHLRSMAYIKIMDKNLA